MLINQYRGTVLRLSVEEREGSGEAGGRHYSSYDFKKSYEGTRGLSS